MKTLSPMVLSRPRTASQFESLRILGTDASIPEFATTRILAVNLGIEASTPPMRRLGTSNRNTTKIWYRSAHDGRTVTYGTGQQFTPATSVVSVTPPLSSDNMIGDQQKGVRADVLRVTPACHERGLEKRRRFIKNMLRSPMARQFWRMCPAPQWPLVKSGWAKPAVAELRI